MCSSQNQITVTDCEGKQSIFQISWPCLVLSWAVWSAFSFALASQWKSVRGLFRSPSFSAWWLQFISLRNHTCLFQFSLSSRDFFPHEERPALAVYSVPQACLSYSHLNSRFRFHLEAWSGILLPLAFIITKGKVKSKLNLCKVYSSHLLHL